MLQTPLKNSAELPYPYSVKRHGVLLANCDDEPVRTPGCIQGHGLMLALNPHTLLVTQASENWPELAGWPIERILGRAVAAIVGTEAANTIAEMLRHEALEANPLYALTIKLPGGKSSTSGTSGTEPLDVSLHLADGVLIAEFEPTGRSGAATIADGDYYSMVKKTLVRLKTAPSLAEFCAIAASETRRITQLDRVMIYRFHADDTGEVIADAHRDDLHSWLGLRYPANDIPKPTRDIFKRIGVRPLPDVECSLIEMVPLLNPDTGRPLDMTHCALRGPSVMYTDYLRNMGVAATLTMPILRDGELWGLIACHHYTPISMPYPVRAAAEFLGQIASLEIAAAESREHLQYRLKLDAAHQAILLNLASDGQLASLAQRTPGLLGGVEASGVAVLEGGQWASGGRTPSDSQLDALLPWLREQVRAAKDAHMVVAVDQLGAHLPSASAFSGVASGLLAFPLSNDADGNWLVWFRPEQVQTFNWGGNPYEKVVATGVHGARLSPRKSFEIWQEEVSGRSAPWKTVEVEAAARLRLLLLDVVIGRARQLEALNSDLTRSNDELDAFAYVAGHDLKEPLRGIHKYAHQLMAEARDGQPMDERGRARIDSLLRLTVRMDSLLDALLHFSRVGRLSLERKDAPLDEVVTDAIDMLGGRLEDSGIALRRPRPLPIVRCDRIRVREIFANLIANAVKYNDKPDRWIEIGYIDPDTEPPPRGLGAPSNAPRTRVFYVRDNGIGIEERHRDRVFMMFKRLHAREAFGGGSGAGLAIVKKLVDQHRGEIWYESTLGVGTTFYFTLPPSSSDQDAANA